MRWLQRRPRAARLHGPASVPKVATDQACLQACLGTGGGGGVGGRHEAMEAEHGAEGLKAAAPQRCGGGGSLGPGLSVNNRGRRLRRRLVEQR